MSSSTKYILPGIVTYGQFYDAVRVNCLVRCVCAFNHHGTANAYRARVNPSFLINNWEIIGYYPQRRHIFARCLPDLLLLLRGKANFNGKRIATLPAILPWLTHLLGGRLRNGETFLASCLR